MCICSHSDSERHWAAFMGSLMMALFLFACGAEGEMDGHDGDDPFELSALGLALEEDKKASGHGRPLHLRRVTFNGQAMVPHPPIDDPRLMFVSGFDELPEDKPGAVDDDKPTEEAQDITGELDPSGVFEVRETGFLPPPILRLERADERRLTIAWDPIQGADGYVATILRFGSRWRGGQSFSANHSRH